MPIAIIVPTLEEVDNIVPLVEQIEQTNVPFGEIIFVDDGSIDGTREKIRALATAHRVRLIEREGAERGLAGAIIAGANASSADVFVVMDADLSHPPEEIASLLQLLLANEADLVIGSRYIPGGATPDWPAWRRFSRASHPRWPIRLPACTIPWADFSRSGASFYCNSLTMPLGSRSSSKQLCVDEKPCECGKSRSCFGIARGGCPRCHSLRRCRSPLAWLRAIGRRLIEGKTSAPPLPAQRLSRD